MMTYIILSLAAIVPAAFYIFYIVAFDSQKLEPLKMLIMSAIIGAVAASLVIWSGIPLSVEEVKIDDAQSWGECLKTGFLGLAVPAELTKWIFLCVFLRLNKYFDEFIDGIVYSVCVAMGFAGIWCVWFVSEFTNLESLEFLEKGLIIFFILVPLHAMASTFMGYYIGLARRKNRMWNYALALLSAIIIDGVLCSLVVIIGNQWEFYLIVAVIFSVLAMVTYTQIYHLLKLDGVSK